VKRQGKLIKGVRKPSPRKVSEDSGWILNLINSPSIIADQNYDADSLGTNAVGVAWGKSLCIACKGGKAKMLMALLHPVFLWVGSAIHTCMLVP